MHHVTKQQSIQIFLLTLPIYLWQNSVNWTGTGTWDIVSRNMQYCKNLPQNPNRRLRPSTTPSHRPRPLFIGSDSAFNTITKPSSPPNLESALPSATESSTTWPTDQWQIFVYNNPQHGCLQGCILSLLHQTTVPKNKRWGKTDSNSSMAIKGRPGYLNYLFWHLVGWNRNSPSFFYCYHWLYIHHTVEINVQ